MTPIEPCFESIEYKGDPFLRADLREFFGLRSGVGNTILGEIVCG